MTDQTIYDILRQGLWTAVLMSAPMLAVALVAGVVIGLFQALTSIQENTLTFVPKVGAMLVVFWASMSFMTATLVAFFQDRIIPMISGG
ncbi:flagellar biosynthetic protein FliQ [Cypionkella sp.]|jgi:flagellar biosynthetic protein FliQ|uniref:flagellar biosynthetic protein FliQ n=1 Tax=Cypionkella sp. TaxID=2811411 RepID=UPI002725E16F|nr:flagellar biosynthetic protein FliQ [Cypionkella sp.]MDO8983428.1 flagellar biosynthetic protein FliQ [Cypionkella sp.]MDP1575535.1 flagellar biosynthetic protein FliQ [Cypionkella sp.]MDP2050272.1 flagellar biosynthetic protein FliQ [Cypionkella sp.]